MKARIVEFSDTEESREHFALIYQGFLSGGNGPGAKPMDVIRREATILDKMEAISYEEMDQESNQPTGKRLLHPGEQRLSLSQPEYELLKRYFENTPWTTKVSRKVVEISDWLSAIPLGEESGGR